MDTALSLSITLAGRFSMAELEFDVKTKRYVLKSTCQDLPRLDCQGLRYPHSTFISTFCMLREHRERCALAIWGALIRLLGFWSRGGHFANLGKHLWTSLNNWMQYTSIRFRLNKWNQMNQVGFNKDPLLSSIFWDPLVSGTMWCGRGITWHHVAVLFANASAVPSCWATPSGDRSNSKRATAAVSSTKRAYWVYWVYWAQLF